MKPLPIAAVAVSLLALSGSSMGVRRAQAQTNPFPPITFPPVTLGMVGLAPGQTARLYALNQPGFLLPANRPLQPNPAPCNLTLTFLDDQGATLKTADLAVDPGKAVHLDLMHDEITRDSSRLQIRGVVQQPVTGPITTSPSPLPTVLGCPVTPTLELFESATGVATVVLSPGTGISFVGFLSGITNPTP